jgi:hypothetical protein
MERRAFIERILSALALGGLFLLGGCGQQKKPATFGNEEGLWQIAAGQERVEEPVDLAYTKGTPALYRDASMGKVDPSFVPKVGGG